MNDIPLWHARAVSLALAGSWAIISFAAGINAVVKSNHDKAMVREVSPPNSTVNINDSDVFQTGAIITVVSIIIFLITSGYLAILIYRPTSFTRSKLITVQASILGFFTAWLFATAVAYTHFFSTRSAHIDAMIGGFQVPDSLVQSIQHQLGLTAVYKDIMYLRLVAILPWIEIFFSFIATVVLFMAASRTESMHHPHRPPAPLVLDEKEKIDSPNPA